MQEPKVIFNPNAKISGQFIGNENNPLLIIDDVLLNPEEIYEYVVNQEFTEAKTSSYPGINAKLFVSYSEALVTALIPLLKAGFKFPPNTNLDIFGFIGVTTKHAEDLLPIQKVPHFDSFDEYRVAILHYFCDDKFGGTGLFRHKTSGAESINRLNGPKLEKQILSELETYNPTTYANKDTPFFELIYDCPAKFNRLIAYRGNCFHSAMLDGNILSSDPKQGRLTLNTFVEPIKSY